MAVQASESLRYTGNRAFKGYRAGLMTALLAGTALAPAPLYAQEAETAEAGAETPAPVVPQAQVIQTIAVSGAQRLEPQTILSYIKIRPGDVYTAAAADAALKDLYATELFSDVKIREQDGNVVIQVVENPIINRIILEGNKRLKDDKILPEIKLAPRQIYTRSKVRADVNRIIELYKRQGRFAATVEPKSVQLDQNRVDIVFEIKEGPKSKVRQINIIGNDNFSDGDLRGEMLTKQTGFLSFIKGGTSYDPDKLAFDQQKLRQFYLTKGYADFRVVSAVAELTPDKKDFIITYVVEEGDRYKFGDVNVVSEIRDFDSDRLTGNLPMKAGEWYNAKMVEDTIEGLSETIGAYGYAFANVEPEYKRNKDDLTMGVTFRIGNVPRVYVEDIKINGNTLTQDKVIRREFRLTEGDAFNSLQVKRTSNRINSLGYFQENFEVEQQPGSTPDRIDLIANVEEKATGELQLSAGFSSLESFILQGSIQQRNFRGRGQTVGLQLNYSRRSKSAQVSFTEPYMFDSNISFGADIYRRDYNSFNYFNKDRSNTYKNSTTGFSLRAGTPLSEYMTIIARYSLNLEDVTLGSRYFRDVNGDGIEECDQLQAGRYLCDAIGKRTSSIFGLSLVYDTLNNRYRPSKGERAVANVDYAGLGGNVHYARARLNAAKYFPVLGNFIFSLQGEGGIIKALKKRNIDFTDDVRLTDRFFLGEPEMRGFDIRGIGPRVVRYQLLQDDNGDYTIRSETNTRDDAIGGRLYYKGRAELEIPLGSGARELGLRPSIFADIGAVWSVKKPDLLQILEPQLIQSRDQDGNLLYTQTTTNGDGTTTSEVVTSPVDPDGNPNDPFGQTISPFEEEFFGDTPKPRVAVGVGVSWNSPFGPLRLDFSRVLLKEPGDDTKTFSFNVGTQF